MAGMAAFLPALISAGGATAGLLQGAPSGNVQRPYNSFQAADATLPYANMYGLTNVTNMPNVYANQLGQFGNIAQSMVGNPGAGQMLQGAQDAAQLGAGAAGSAYGMGNFLTGVGQGLYPYAGQILNQGFDPQNDLYNRTQHQLQEQTRSGQAARGLGLSPFGAGLENKAMSDFNIDWQNNLLGRMNTAAQGAGSLIGQGNQTVGQGVGMMGAAPGMLQQTSMFPYTANKMIGQDALGALGQYGAYGMAATQQPQQSLQDLLQIFGLGNNSANVSNNQFGNSLTQAQQGFNQNQVMGSNLGNSLSSLGKGMGGSAVSSGGSSSAFMPSQSFMNNSWGWG